MGPWTVVGTLRWSERNSEKPPLCVFMRDQNELRPLRCRRTVSVVCAFVFDRRRRHSVDQGQTEPVAGVPERVQQADGQFLEPIAPRVVNTVGRRRRLLHRVDRPVLRHGRQSDDRRRSGLRRLRVRAAAAAIVVVGGRQLSPHQRTIGSEQRHRVVRLGPYRRVVV